MEKIDRRERGCTDDRVGKRRAIVVVEKRPQSYIIKIDEAKPFI